MSCQQCRQWWSPYLDSELDAGTTFEVSEHLRTCATCRNRFEREAFVDDCLRTKLRAVTMPEGLWSSICQGVRHEAAPGASASRGLPTVQSLTSMQSSTSTDSSTTMDASTDRTLTLRQSATVRRTLAVAASIAMLLFAGVYYSATKPTAEPDPTVGLSTSTPVIPTKLSITELLQEAEPRLAAFTQPPAADFHERLDAVCRKTLGVSVRIDPAETDGHPIELIDVFERVDSTGNPYVEVRLNCCGQPMLLAFAKADSENGIVELCCPTANCETTCETGCKKQIPAEVQSVARGEVMIAAVAVNHQVTSVLNAIHVEPS